MKKIKYLMCAVLVCLITLFACIPKVSAYSDYTSINNTETVLYDTEHEITITNSLDINSNGFGNLSLYYTYRLIDGQTFLWIFGYEYDANGVSYSDRDDFYIKVDDELLNLIDVESDDRIYIDYIKNTLDTYMIYLDIQFVQYEVGYITPLLVFHDKDYNWFENELELIEFEESDFFVNGFTNDIPLEVVHTNMLYETYLYNRYRLDGNTLSQIEDISIIDWLINSVGGLFDTPILGGVSIGDILMFVLAIGLLFLFLRFFAGG